MRIGVVLLAAIAAVVAVPAAAKPRGDTLVVISIDGFRADYITRPSVPTLARLARQGVTTTAMRPAFPSVTLPNHTTLITGKTPDHHGVIDNLMVDPALPGWFGGPGPDVTGDPRWWAGAKPLWASAADQGVPAAELFWPGANVPYAGNLPTLRRPQENLPANARADAMLDWLDLPEASRPRLILGYFGPVDDAGHSFGPATPQVDQALGEVDEALARLLDGLARRKLLKSTNLVIVSDHGMTGVSYGRMVMIDKLIDLAWIQPTTFGATFGVNPLPGHAAKVERALLRQHEHMTCWRKSAIPARLRYSTNPRIPAIFCLAEPGWTIGAEAVTAWLQQHYPLGFRGNHGYDPALPEMAALFVASGPAFRPRTRLKPFDNVNVYALLTTLLGIRGEPGDGSVAAFRPALRR